MCQESFETLRVGDIVLLSSIIRLEPYRHFTEDGKVVTSITRTPSLTTGQFLYRILATQFPFVYCDCVDLLSNNISTPAIIDTRISKVMKANKELIKLSQSRWKQKAASKNGIIIRTRKASLANPCKDAVQANLEDEE